METNNKPAGFYYSVTDEQILEHRQRSLLEVFEWLESTRKFIYNLQSPEERERMEKIRKGEF